MKEGQQPYLEGFAPNRRRLRRARTALKSVPYGERSRTMEDVMAKGFSSSYRQSAQAWLDTNGSFTFRETDSIAHLEAISPDVADAINDPDEALTESIQEAKKRNLPAVTVAKRLAQETRYLSSQSPQNKHVLTRHLFHTYDLIGKVYVLHEDTVARFKREALSGTAKLDPRLR